MRRRHAQYQRRQSRDKDLNHLCARAATPEFSGKDFNEGLNPKGLKVITAFAAPSLATTKSGNKFEFERRGYFVADRVDHAVGKLVFNSAVGLKDFWLSNSLTSC